MTNRQYETQTEKSRPRRIAWFKKARFGMFIHWGLYSVLGRSEWAMNRERTPVNKYEKLIEGFNPVPRPARDWARLAKKSGARYIVMVAKHHEGYCLWDTAQTDYNSVKRGPGRDFVQEFVDACREFDLQVGIYYSLMDWHHPDGVRCYRDSKARRRFLDFTQGCLRELLTNYGKIDILWYDIAWPLDTVASWEAYKMNEMARSLQPDILINNRSIPLLSKDKDKTLCKEDFGTPEEHVTPEKTGRAWEACMTTNGSWGYMPSAIDWLSPRSVIKMLRTVSGYQGNLLLNIGPKPDGTVPPEARELFTSVGKWIAKNGEAMYGEVERIDGRMEWVPTGHWSIKGKTAYFWCDRWPGKELIIGGLKCKVQKASFLAGGKPIKFTQSGERLILKGLPLSSPDTVAGITVIKLECASRPRQVLGPCLKIP